tara:strand:+ start:658 stop:1317 length:660 start_codon:yes stop_codon:yes gene_type:complete
MKTSWNKIIDEYNNTPPLEDILLFITNNSITTNKPVFPDNYFKCFDYCDIDKIKVVIIGQDPYHGVNQATGLCFAIQENIKIPPSLKNIKKELLNDLNIELTDHTLVKWAKQGVLLINSAFSVLQGKPGVHISIWKNFTDHIISSLNKQNGIVFVAWGSFAYDKLKFIDTNKHRLFVSSHPSPLSCYKNFKNFPSFNNSRPFTKINNLLHELNHDSIDW